MTISVMAHYQVREDSNDADFRVEVSEMENWDGTHTLAIRGRAGDIVLFLDPAQVEAIHGTLAQYLAGEGEA